MADEKKKPRKSASKTTKPKSNEVVPRDERLIARLEERFNKKVEFLLDQQAQSGEKAINLESVVTRLANYSFEKHDKLEDATAALIASQERLTVSQEKTDERLDALLAAQERLTVSQERLAETQERTGEALQNLIVTVDRYLSNGRSDGKSRK